jgi:hypothetical protein
MEVSFNGGPVRMFRHKPCFINAMQFDGENASELSKFAGKHFIQTGNKLLLTDRGNTYYLEKGDFLVRTATEVYALSEEIFWNNYEEIKIWL